MDRHWDNQLDTMLDDLQVKFILIQLDTVLDDL